MIIHIETDVVYKGRVVHVQDTDYLDQSAKVGRVDENGLVSDAVWVPWADIAEGI